ncbi:unnamed protein product [Timema podura]|uniref:Transmembrane protein 216 n=1 Tax=Timema podura TaxID=61482 RepID=A0ABN7NKU4_TIMPD|nr:unnamed protein product [Timema podura]
MFMLCELGMAMFKIANFPIPTSNYVSEIVLLIFVCLTESSRIFLGRKGNLTGNSVCLLLSIILLIPSALGVLYFLLWQTYVFRLEAILCYIQLTFQSLQLLFSVTHPPPYRNKCLPARMGNTPTFARKHSDVDGHGGKKACSLTKHTTLLI